MNILVTGHLPKEIMNLLGKEHTVESNLKDRPMNRQNLLKKIKDKQGLLSMVADKIDQEFFNQAPQLQMIANYAVGYDNIDLKGATERGIWVSNTPGILTEATADLTFALILSVARRVVAGDRIMRAGKYKY